MTARTVARLLCPWGFSRQEYWSGLPCLPPGDLPNAGIEPRSPTLQADSLPSEPPGKPIHIFKISKKNHPTLINTYTASWCGLTTWEGNLILKAGPALAFQKQRHFNLYFSHGHSFLLASEPFYIIIKTDVWCILDRPQRVYLSIKFKLTPA